MNTRVSTSLSPYNLQVHPLLLLAGRGVSSKRQRLVVLCAVVAPGIVDPPLMPLLRASGFGAEPRRYCSWQVHVRTTMNHVPVGLAASLIGLPYLCRYACHCNHGIRVLSVLSSHAMSA